MHSQAISLFIREPESLTEEQFDNLKALLHEHVPEHDFGITHIKLQHDLQLCMNTFDIFAHPDATSQKQFQDEFITEPFNLDDLPMVSEEL